MRAVRLFAIVRTRGGSMSGMRGRSVFLIVMLAFATREAAAAADARFDLSGSIGYSHLWLNGSKSPFDERDGFRFEPRFSFAPSDNLRQLRLGFAVGISGFEKRQD